jgi:hypothetical protein
MAKRRPAKGKAVVVKVGKRNLSVGQAGKKPRPGTKAGHSYCARSLAIKKCSNPPCANDVSRDRWGCKGDRSYA